MIDSYKCRSTLITVDHITVEVKKKRYFDGPNKPPYIPVQRKELFYTISVGLSALTSIMFSRDQQVRNSSLVKDRVLRKSVVRQVLSVVRLYFRD